MIGSKQWKEEINAPSDYKAFKWRRIWRRVTPHYYFQIEVREWKEGSEKYEVMISGAKTVFPRTSDEWGNPWRERSGDVDIYYVGRRFKGEIEHMEKKEFGEKAVYSALTKRCTTQSEAVHIAKSWMSRLETVHFDCNGVSLIALRQAYEEKGIQMMDYNIEWTWDDFYNHSIKCQNEIEKEKVEFVTKEDLMTNGFCVFKQEEDEKYYYLTPLGKERWQFSTVGIHSITTRKEFEKMIDTIYKTLTH